MAEATIPDTVLEWSRGLASLSPGVPPCVRRGSAAAQTALGTIQV